MEKNLICFYVMNTLSDWECGYALAELHSRRYFKKNAPDFRVKTVSHSNKEVTTMGGIRIVPDFTIEEMDFDQIAMLVLPGSEDWNNPQHAPVLELAERLLDRKIPVAAICGATAAIANRGLLDNRKHTSDDLTFLEQTCKHYKGSANYIKQPAVEDGNIITASAVGSLEFAYEIIKKLDVFTAETLDAWYNLFDTKKPEFFYKLTEALQNKELV
jgi:putative intracellular protease/amidase